ncbi:lipopolysaccharide assembly protein LapA domain-containing protein [Halobacillus shinanisalinarum]|uniref:Lipopolysaccharide assembly protein LapA domain-containing protein n=1 Tax=Halobacillus shinanisalinarum TaxID=2932258 RepID=A0ABY4H0L8_9BACI|nr:lipopolysaccharide assembly protein LapA domain-containing protein [Halobacillus shinanisalinarum]UOQ93841.1 lipopolysaccharide assembly protein LapA domain-containing protein [Halobacillus shinanisalinarum]
MKGQTYIILALIFALLIAVFAVINVDPVQVNYLFGTGEAPLILVIIVSVLMGVLITASVGAVRFFRLQRENRSLTNQLEKKNSEHATPNEFSAAQETTEKADDASQAKDTNTDVK